MESDLMQSTRAWTLATLLTVFLLVDGRPVLGAGSAVPDADSGATEPANADAAHWERVTEHAAFSERDTAEEAVFLGKMWLSNGYYYDNVLTRDLWNSADGVTWTRVSEATPYDGYSEFVVFEDKLWAVKGSVWNSSDGLAWTPIAPSTPFSVRSYGEVVVHDGKMWQLGSGEDVWSSSDGAAWTCAAEHAPFGKRFASGVLAFNDRIWLMGGAITATSDPPEKQYPKFTTFNDVWSSADGVTWERMLEHAAWPPRMWFAVKEYRDEIWIIGGFDNVHGANLDDVWHSKDGVTWVRFDSPTVFSPRHEPACYVYNGSLWVVAGNSWPLMNDVWQLTIPTLTQATSTPGK